MCIRDRFNRSTQKLLLGRRLNQAQSIGRNERAQRLTAPPCLHHKVQNLKLPLRTIHISSITQIDTKTQVQCQTSQHNPLQWEERPTGTIYDWGGYQDFNKIRFFLSCRFGFRIFSENPELRFSSKFKEKHTDSKQAKPFATATSSDKTEKPKCPASGF